MVLTGATHRVQRIAANEVLLVSELEFEASAGPAASWKVPISGAHDIAAELDGRAVPLFIEAGGQQATMTIPGPGMFNLRVRRSITAPAQGPATTLVFPVNPSPSARLILERPAGSLLSRPGTQVSVKCAAS